MQAPINKSIRLVAGLYLSEEQECLHGQLLLGKALLDRWLKLVPLSNLRVHDYFPIRKGELATFRKSLSHL